MNKLSIIILLLLAVLFSSSCTSEATLFRSKAIIDEHNQEKETLIGHWITELDNSLVLGIQQDGDHLNLKTSEGQLAIVTIKKLSDLAFVLEVDNGGSIEKLMAMFSTYEKTSLTLMNAQIVPGMSSEITVTFKKAKEEATLTASSKF